MLWWVRRIVAIDRGFLVTVKFICFPGLDKIEFLQSHEKLEIYEKAFNIIQTYFGNDEEDTGVAPIADDNEYQFNVDQSAPMGGFQF